MAAWQGCADFCTHVSFLLFHVGSSAPSTRDRETNLQLRACRSECVCEVRIHRQNMQQDSTFLLLLCTFLLRWECESRGCSPVIVRTAPTFPGAPLSSSLPSFSFDLIPAFAGKTNLPALFLLDLWHRS